MLRYNNQSAMSKPVDYYRPLTVDVSVEYELPKEVAPPPGSAPLLIIHPSAYFRSKVSQPLSTSSSSSLTSHKNAPLSSRSSRHDLNPTLYYLNSNKSTSSNSHIGHLNNQSHLTSNHIKSLRHGSALSGSVTRSRSVIMSNPTNDAVRGSMNMNCPYGKYDDYSASTSNVMSLSSSNNTKVSSAMKKVGSHPTTDRLSYSYSSNAIDVGSSNNNHNIVGNHNLSANLHGPGSSFGVSTNPAGDIGVSTTTASGMNFGGGGSILTSHTTAGTVSNKRLRMMNQHQSSMLNPPLQPMEPLNLAITPSASNSLLNPPYHNNIQLSTFVGNNYKGSHNGSSSHMTGLGINYGSTFPNNHRTLNPSSAASQNLYSAQSQRYPKECPVPVDKGSGSDSGVCSENDSDVSPPMAPFSGHARRSILSQELPTSGCYCCCCPTTSSSSSRKNSTSSSHSKSKSSISSNQNQHYQQHPLGVNNSNVSSKLSHPGGGLSNNNHSSSNSNSSGSLLNYGMNSLNSTISMSMMTMPHDGHMSSMSTEPSSLGTSPLDLDSTYRKWFGGSVGPGLVVDGNSSSLGRWFQV